MYSITTVAINVLKSILCPYRMNEMEEESERNSRKKLIEKIPIEKRMTIPYVKERMVYELIELN